MAPRQHPLKSVCLDSLTKRVIKIRSLHREDRECASCMERMHEPVSLHDKHYLCRSCAEHWLQGSNECPHCRRKLFRGDRATYRSLDDGPLVRVSINNDRENLDRLRNLDRAWQHGKTAARRHDAEYRWRTISNARIELFRTGRYAARKNNYAKYRLADKRTSHRFQRHDRAWNAKRALQAEHLISQLAQRNCWLAPEGIRRRPRPRPQNPSIACHPLVAEMAANVARILRLADGKRVSAAQLQFMSANGGRGMMLVDAATALEEEKAFALHMAEGVVAMHAGFDVRPKGQAVHVRRARLTSVEQEDGVGMEMMDCTEDDEEVGVSGFSGRLVRVERGRVAKGDGDISAGARMVKKDDLYTVGTFLEK